MDRKLVFDVGVNDGADSAYYLRSGYRVVGIEASPVVAERLRQRFAAEIAAGAYELLEVGIAETEGLLTFWVCDDVPEWSSFDPALAGRNGSAHHPVTVATRPFDAIMKEHDRALYCKIDIEGHDLVCLRQMRNAARPEFLSVEMHHGRGDEQIAVLRELGYTRFKIVSQVTRAQPSTGGTYLKARLPNRASRWVQGLERRVCGVSSDGDWRFAWGSSGVFGETTPGPWHDANAILKRWRQLRIAEPGYIRHGLVDWYDFHAAA